MNYYLNKDGTVFGEIDCCANTLDFKTCADERFRLFLKRKFGQRPGQEQGQGFCGLREYLRAGIL